MSWRLRLGTEEIRRCARGEVGGGRLAHVALPSAQGSQAPRWRSRADGERYHPFLQEDLERSRQHAEDGRLERGRGESSRRYDGRLHHKLAKRAAADVPV